MTIVYHLGKDNIVADGLSRKTSNMGSLVAIRVKEPPLARDVQRLANGLVRHQLSNDGNTLAFLLVRSTLMDLIREHQFQDKRLCFIKDRMIKGEVEEAILDADGVLRIGNWICVPKVGDLMRFILEEAHCSRYPIHTRIDILGNGIGSRWIS